MYILVALQAMAMGISTNLFWQPVGEFSSIESCKAAIVQLQKAKVEQDKETYVCLKQ